MTALALGVYGWFAADEPPQPQQHDQKSEIEAIVVKVTEDNDLPPTTDLRPLALSLTQMRLPATAALQLCDIAIHGVTVEHVEGPGERGAFGGPANIVTGAAAIIYMKIFELMLETTGELILQSYKAALDYFAKHVGAPDMLLVASRTRRRSITLRNMGVCRTRCSFRS